MSVFCAAMAVLYHPAPSTVHRNANFVVHLHCVCQWTHLLVVIEGEPLQVLFIIDHSTAAELFSDSCIVV